MPFSSKSRKEIKMKKIILVVGDGTGKTYTEINGFKTGTTLLNTIPSGATPDAIQKRATDNLVGAITALQTDTAFTGYDYNADSGKTGYADAAASIVGIKAAGNLADLQAIATKLGAAATFVDAYKVGGATFVASWPPTGKTDMHYLETDKTKAFTTLRNENMILS